MTNCDWCEAKAVVQVELEPARLGTDKRTGTKVTKKPAKLAWACDAHKNIVNEQPPFYTCGCSYVEGEFRCPRHTNLLRHPHRERMQKEVIKGAPRRTSEGKIIVR